MSHQDCCLIGRTSSHFTRAARLFAEEVGLHCAFRPIADLLSREVGDYGGNPALRMPVLETPEGTWFGSLNICRELDRRASMWNSKDGSSTSRRKKIVWPEQLATPLLANAQELTVQAMSTEVTLILTRLGGAADGPLQVKMETSLLNSLAWLDARLDEVLSALPSDRDLSFLEVTLYCLVTHLEFREVLPMQPYTNLRAFSDRFGARPSALATAYRF